MKNAKHIDGSLTIKRADTEHAFGVVVDSLVQSADGQVKAFGARASLSKSLPITKEWAEKDVGRMVNNLREAWVKETKTACHFLTDDVVAQATKVLLG